MSVTGRKQPSNRWQSINPTPGVATTNSIDSEYRRQQVRSDINKKLDAATLTANEDTVTPTVYLVSAGALKLHRGRSHGRKSTLF
jgi:hypothetical protein